MEVDVDLMEVVEYKTRRKDGDSKGRGTPEEGAGMSAFFCTDCFNARRAPRVRIAAAAGAAPLGAGIVDLKTWVRREAGDAVEGRLRYVMGAIAEIVDFEARGR